MTFKPHRADPRDANEAELVALAESLGASFFKAPPLDGWLFCPRLWKGALPVEIKDPKREGLQHEYTSKQAKFFRWCNDRALKWLVWRTQADVLRDVGARVSA
jgi:hypothetical protein